MHLEEGFNFQMQDFLSMTLSLFNVIVNQLTEEEFERKKKSMVSVHWCSLKP